MASSYTKSYSSDFGGKIDTSVLHQAVVDDVGVTTSFLGVDKVAGGDDVLFWFVAEPTVGDKAAIDVIAAAHTYTPPKLQHYKIHPKDGKLDEEIYETIGTFSYPGSDAVGTIDAIEVLSFMEPGLANYEVVVVDHTNNKTIAAATFTNTKLSEQELGTISNVPTGSAVISILGKIEIGTTVDDRAVVYEIEVYYGNNN
ncbi:unnamed protein product [marine sediment metagenome]|uniref:Uncharacterized protein n=1 Tax=marine sediment metagenome TaxID=412755 RepID=X1ADS6_9ZZZZ